MVVRSMLCPRVLVMVRWMTAAVVMVVADMEMQMENPGAELAMAVPVTNGMESETRKHQGHQHHRQRTKPPYAALKASPEPKHPEQDHNPGPAVHRKSGDLLRTVPATR